MGDNSRALGRGRAARWLLVLALTCAGCATQPQSSQPRPAPQSQSSQPAVNLSGYSASFKQGYTDGCDSARASLRRDERRYRNDGDYMMGWNDGNSVCQRSR